MTALPSTEWTEVIAPDEEARFAGYAEQIGAVQRASAATHGSAGRALHRTQHLGMRATVTIAADVPAYAKHGLFAQAGTYEAQIRLSSGSGAHQPDKKADVRGFALRILGVEGDGALGRPTTEQHFLLINQPTFAIASADDFIGLVTASARGDLAVVRHMIKRHGFFAGLREVKRIATGLGKPFAGFAVAPFYSAAPVAVGPYAAKVRVLPKNPAEPTSDKRDLAANVIARLAAGALAWDLQLQFYVDAKTTPIEDATVEWPEATAPWVTVGRLTAPQQDPSALTDAIGKAKFDPWAALAAHRPLGEIMRARKAAYFTSTQGRGV